MKNSHISDLLFRMYFTLASNYSLSQIMLNAVVFLLVIAQTYAFPSLEPTTKPVQFQLFSRLISIAIFSVLYLVTKHCKCRGVIIIMHNVLPIFAFEVNSYFLSIYEAYLIFALFFNSFREVVLLNISTKHSFLSFFAVIVYHTLRAIVCRSSYKDQFSIFTFVSYIVSYVIINIPIIACFSTLQNVIKQYDDLKNDFENVTSSLPIPIFKFTLQPQSILMTNHDFDALLANIQLSNDLFLQNLIQKSHILNLINDRIPCGSVPFIYRDIEYNVKYRILEQNNGSTYTACIQDLSLVKQIESLKAKESYKRMYISSISHQLRTPLNGVCYPLYLIKELKCSPQIQEHVDLAINSLDMLKSLIEDTIAFSDCDSGRMVLNLREVSITEELSKLRNMFITESKMKGVPFEMSIKLSSSTVVADIKKITQVLMILISNSFKYTYKGKINLLCFQSSKSLNFIISDTGTGISSEAIPTLFNEFGATEYDQGVTSSNFRLALVKKLVQLMKGSITVESQPNQGTKFSFAISTEWENFNNSQEIEIPNEICIAKNVVTHPSLENIKLCKTITLNPTRIINDDTVLIVDDNATNVLVLEKMLSMMNIKTEKAMNGLECINMVSQRGMDGYTMILMDINMPVMNGIEAARSISKMIRDKKVCSTPIVAVTAQNDSGILQQCISVGMVKCILKPIKIVELKSMMVEYCARDVIINPSTSIKLA